MHRDSVLVADTLSLISHHGLNASLENPVKAKTRPQTTTNSENQQFVSSAFTQSSEIPPSSEKTLPYKSNMPQDLDELEKAEETPRSSSCIDPLSPRQPLLRGTSGRRPLSIISNSSFSSDVSPPSKSPDPFSPNRHRSHRSVIGASVDYKSQSSLYSGCYQNLHAYSNPFQSPHSPCQNQGLNITNSGLPSSQDGAHNGVHHGAHYGTHSGTHNRAYNNLGIQSNLQEYNQHQSFSGSSTNSPGCPLIDPLTTTPLMGSGGFSQHPMAFQSPLSPPLSSSEIPAAISLAAAAAATSIGIQDIFVALAYKERQVLEARQNWEAAQVDLESFRRQLDSMLAPEVDPLILPVRPSIISRRCTSNVGIHSVQFSPVSHSNSREQGPQVILWRIDSSVPTPSQPADLDEMAEQFITQQPDESHNGRHTGLTLTIIKCLLGIVNCVISTLPVYQRDIAHQGRRAIVWTPEYPMPMDTLFGHLA